MKKLQILKKVGIVLVVIIGIFLILNIIPSKKVVAENTWRPTEKEFTLIGAEKGGSAINPENTRKAFDSVIRSTSYSNIIEFDVRTSSDNQLVIINDETVNRTGLPADAEIVKVHDKTVAELKKYNLGINFVNATNKKPYESLSISSATSQGLAIMTVEEFLDRYMEYRSFRLFIDIKESGELGTSAVDKLVALLDKAEYDWYDGKVMLTSENEDVINYMGKKQIDLAFGAAGAKTHALINTQKLGLQLFYTPKYQMINVNTKEKTGLFTMNLTNKSFITRLHSKNICICFTGVSDKDEIIKLVAAGADVIMTPDPKTVYTTFDEKDYR